MKRCPYCAEEIQDEAIKCRHCHEKLKKPQSLSKGRSIFLTSQLKRLPNLARNFVINHRKTIFSSLILILAGFCAHYSLIKLEVQDRKDADALTPEFAEVKQRHEKFYREKSSILGVLHVFEDVDNDFTSYHSLDAYNATVKKYELAVQALKWLEKSQEGSIEPNLPAVVKSLNAALTELSDGLAIWKLKISSWDKKLYSSDLRNDSWYLISLQEDAQVDKSVGTIIERSGALRTKTLLQGRKTPPTYLMDLGSVEDALQLMISEDIASARRLVEGTGGAVASSKPETTAAISGQASSSSRSVLGKLGKLELNYFQPPVPPFHWPATPHTVKILGKKVECVWEKGHILAQRSSLENASGRTIDEKVKNLDGVKNLDPFADEHGPADMMDVAKVSRDFHFEGSMTTDGTIEIIDHLSVGPLPIDPDTGLVSSRCSRLVCSVNSGKLAPKTVLTATWLVVWYMGKKRREILNETSISVPTAGRPADLDFFLKATHEKFLPATYRVELRANGKLLRYREYTVLTYVFP